MSVMKLKCWNKILVVTGALCPCLFYVSLMIIAWFADEGRWNAFGKYVLVPFALVFLWCGGVIGICAVLTVMAINRKRFRSRYGRLGFLFLFVLFLVNVCHTLPVFFWIWKLLR